MKTWYNKDDCEQLRAYHAYYPVPVAAMLWCQVPPDEVEEEMKRTSPHPNIRGVFTHPYIPCLEVRCRILHQAIEAGSLPASREKGVVTAEHIAPEKRHVSREALKAWIAKEHPADKPPFLFDAVERNTHSSIKVDAYAALQADRDALQTRLKKTLELLTTANQNLSEITGQRDSLAAAVGKQTVPNARAETTYLNIIGAMLALLQDPQPGRDSAAAVIQELLDNYEGKPGISKTTLEGKFADANRSIRGT